MKDIRLKAIKCENFKGLPPIAVDFGDMNITDITGANATGKTSINDLVWWVLFGKDSRGNEKFEVRRLLPNGEKEHQTVITGVVQLVVDDAVVTFQKDQKEIWQTKRGFTEQVFKGNQNQYMINGYPVTETEYKARVNEIVNEDIFRMITSPSYFVSMPWKDQRQVLMSLVSEESDTELAIKLGGYDLIIDDLTQAPDTDSAQAKYRKAMADLNAQQKELPIRIDEALHAIEDLDFDGISARYAEVEAEMAEIDKQLQTDDTEARKSALESEIALIGRQLQTMEWDLDLDVDSKKNELRRKLSDLQSERQALLKEADRRTRDLNAEKASIERQMEAARKEIATAEEKKDLWNKRWMEWKAETYVEGETTCPTCGQPLPEKMLASRKEAWEHDHRLRYDEIMANGNNAVQKCDQANEALAGYIAELKRVMESIEEAKSDSAQVDSINAEIEKVTAELGELKLVDPMTVPDYVALVTERDAKRAELASLGTDAGKTELTQKRIALWNERNQLDIDLSKKDANAKAQARAEQLRAELREVSEKALQMEGKIELLDQFIRAKLDYISNSINKQFDGITWKLFDLQINGGIRPTCELMVNGVPYNTLNNGARICAGLRVIKTMQQIYDVRSFLFVDNAEAVNKDRFPEMTNQMIYLRVTEDKELKFENK